MGGQLARDGMLGLVLETLGLQDWSGGGEDGCRAGKVASRIEEQGKPESRLVCRSFEVPPPSRPVLSSSCRLVY